MARFRAYISESEDESHESTSEAEEKEVPPEAEVVKSHGRYRMEESENSSSEGEEESESESEEDVQSMLSESPPPVDRSAPIPTTIPWVRGVGVDPKRMHVMQTALFRVPEEASAMQEVEAQTKAQSRKKLVLNGTLNRKHSRDSEGDGLRAESAQRRSFSHDIELFPYRPTRKYARVVTAASIVGGNENAWADAGLSMGRSFRVGWGPGGTLAHLGRLCGPLATTEGTANSSTVTITTVAIFASPEDESIERATKLLSHHLSHKNNHPTIVLDSEGVPCANPSPELTFSSFSTLFAPTDNSFEASLFRLGHALFDPLDLRLSGDMPLDARDQIIELHRKTALSDWFQTIVVSSVDSDLRSNPGADWASIVFSHLTGNQVARACDVAIDVGNVRLATLLSQCPGDDEYKEDLRAQLALWREQKVDTHISDSVRKIYALLAGIVGSLDGSGGTDTEHCHDLEITKGLDWKRAFGLQLWFGQSVDTPIAEVFASYRAHHGTMGTPGSPVPWYTEGPAEHQPPSWKVTPDIPDILFSLIQLFSDPNLTLSDILIPFSYGATPLDYRLAWHLYIVLSRSLRIRDLSDRADPGPVQDPDDGDHVEGHSPSADLLTNSYSMQLERLGLIQEAAFVLLHIEGSAGRRKAIKDLLYRSAPHLDDYMLKGLCGSLRIPEAWVNEAKAVYALDRGNIYDAYEHYLTAGMYNAAHDLAVLQLAPEVVIRKDIGLLRDLFQRFVNQPVHEWHVRGKVFLDYAHAVTRLPELREHVQSDAVIDAIHASEIEEFSRSIPKLIAILPDVLPDRSSLRHVVAISEMTTDLTLRLDQLKPLAIQNQPRTGMAPESTRLRHVHAASLHRFLRTIEAS